LSPSAAKKPCSTATRHGRSWALLSLCRRMVRGAVVFGAVVVGAVVFVAVVFGAVVIGGTSVLFDVAVRLGGLRAG
jgi:hypothetical protein